MTARMTTKNRTTSPFTSGLDAVLFVLDGKWKALIVFHLSGGPRRYGDLRRAVGRVSDKVLAQQLKELQADGIIERRDYGEIPPKVEYSLTPFGASLMQALHNLCEWGSAHGDALSAIVARRVQPPTVPEGTTPEGTMPEGTKPEDTMPEDTMQEGGAQGCAASAAGTSAQA